ncbi:malonate decarboxylase holo-[acyl-carrier-protein] synthase [Massilia sp. W12]|uniref:malonate decarboxylase holo-[acyl-carrier-protein] synthase n=1 Tax=Massilia sp. W12 TaxID=3126507 RepID=UPI0030CD9220
MMQRHDWLWLQPAAWHGVLAQAAQAGADWPELALWPQQAWPLVCARQTRPGVLSAGLSLPPAPDGGKRRLSLQLAPDALLRSSAPPLLSELTRSPDAPPALQHCAHRLHAWQLRVYGAHAWQWQTGLPYLHAGSDLDLLYYARSLDDLQAALRRWHACAQDCAQQGLRLDGEVILPDGAGLAWRECWQAMHSGGQVLLKRLHSVQLQDWGQVCAQLPRQDAPCAA